ncbi:prolyl-tRNA synthetase associated domain-containing protein [uncultured Eubacterium sp.]|uniref:prolyl-tRNA synthetase associated domain-containing protein n=1 Tax=uncultured Eubacterium sp. TaxID=165185 RepID=UPI0025F4722C|nr:prolyl-tRNA synthetase associated domain-containing protein [uncultured Eubacterium sp.]
MKLVKGRPLDTERRLKKEVRVYDLLDELGMEYWRIDHEAAQTMEDCEDVDRMLDAVICKNLFLCNRQKTKFYLLMIPGEKTFKTKELSAQIQSARLSFAPEEYMEKFLDITPGSVSIMGLMNDTENQVQLLVDADVLEGEYLGCHPCINTSSLKLRTRDVFTTYLNAVHHDYIVVHLGTEQEK